MTEFMTRRHALKLGMTTLGAAAATFGQVSHAEIPERKNPLCVFTKPFNSLSFSELADKIAELGFNGIEAPIRAGGHIEPNQVEDKLPELVEALKKRGLEVTVMTSDINDPRDPLTEKVLRVAGGLGIRRYRMKYLIYDNKHPVAEQLKTWHDQLVDLAAMNGELGIKGVYQNHAGNKQLGAPLWDIREVLQGISPDEIGIAYDIRHATIEGGMSWPITFQAILPHLDTVYVKDAIWENERAKNVPLGQGMVPQSFFKMLVQAGFSGPISLHEEYLDHRKPELVPEHWAAIKQDLQTLENWLKTANKS